MPREEHRVEQREVEDAPRNQQGPALARREGQRKSDDAQQQEQGEVDIGRALGHNENEIADRWTARAQLHLVLAEVPWAQRLENFIPVSGSVRGAQRGDVDIEAAGLLENQARHINRCIATQRECKRI